LQPDFGWGGDLAVGARVEIHGAPAVGVDVVVERARGDLTVTDEIGTQSLGFTDLRLGVTARDGVWNFTTLVAGSTLGVASGSVTARTGSATTWPEATTPIDGKVDLRVANLGTWGRWVPAGWRLTGEVHADASVGGRFGAPEYTGHVEGASIGVRNFLQGVNVKDGSVAIALQGTSARIERFTATGGSGTVSLEGDASFGTAPAANLTLRADKFEMLGRLDRRIVTSGSAALRLDAKTVALDGSFAVDEGLIDFTRSDAPTLGDDVEVIRRPAGVPAPAVAATAAASPGSAPAPIAPPAARKVGLDLRVAMGEKLRIRGRGLDARLRGELHLTSPGGRLAVDGTLRAVDGTYQAYGQKLGIDRGVLTFVGPIESPRLDIEATRPNLDVRVGVVVVGTALNPRIRLFSEPDMSDIDKLSWLVLGRASEGVGRADTALLQRAALALLSGEGPGVTDRITHAIGLDEISVRQQGQGDVKETIIGLGKQISKRWYVGYERGLNATTGSWQLIYRIAQRLTVRAQAGGDNSLDLIWTLRWQ
jgi:translocation and assembly module TamB